MGSRVPTSILLADLLRNGDADRLTAGDIVDRLGERSFGLTLLVLGLLAAMPGVSALTGPVIAVLAIQMLLGWPAPRLPRGIAQRPFGRRRLARIVRWSRPVLLLVERVATPRWTTPFQATKRVVGGIVLAVAALLFAPIPFSNVPPALVIVLVALAYVAEDGLLLCCALLGALVLLAVAGGAVWEALSGLGWVEGFL